MNSINNNELMSTIRVHSFESFGTVDGPGVRFIIFVQGCPLKCKFCHNRDTWETKNAGTEYTIKDLLEKVKRVLPYINSSKEGGVTISGGEPLLQAKNLIFLFKALKDMGIHTCLDTSGGLPITDDIKELLKYTDLVLLDIKHIDNQKAINLTGVSNKNELEFAKYLSNNNIAMWIRQVLIPGYTDNEKDLIKLKAFIDTLKTVKKIEILPYHDYGKFKWKELGEKYELENVPSPTDEEILKAKKILGI